MNANYHHALFVAVNMLIAVTLTAAEEPKPKKEEQVQLEPFAHEFYWESFTVTKDARVSPDGRYRLKKVARNGSVELIFSASPTESEVIVVKPMPKKPEKGSRPPTIVVVESDAKAQTATIKELRMK
ncbi:hypothetical protein ASA1KI_37590 [Opitutales bacterium ASA1]|uniref:hypothetical protein n=1 Tax=Congregicoccus parvus TaxID=3081749 RepID=UPI002B3040CF|nr:hypothetical protein ASA1KI_37590 [Opitutales bacterium ASA1]